jgi:hypothetical protein
VPIYFIIYSESMVFNFRACLSATVSLSCPKMISFTIASMPLNDQGEKQTNINNLLNMTLYDYGNMRYRELKQIGTLKNALWQVFLLVINLLIADLI